MNYNFIEKIHSTNSFVKEKIAELPDWYIIRAGEQTGGRGRFERVWRCEKHKDIAMSVLIPTDEKILPFLPNLTQITGISVAQVLDKFVETKIKWANDILVNGRKICGILTEAITLGGSVKVVAGIGLNVNSERKKQDDILAVSLFDETKRIFDLDDLAKEIAQNIFKNIQILRQKGIVEFIEKLNEKLAFKNEQKTIIDGERKICGTVIGIDEKGELLFQTSKELLKIISGEISFERTITA